MIGRFTQARRKTRTNRPAPKPRWRPSLESLESRLAPSLTPLFVQPDVASLNMQVCPIQVANQLPVPVVAATPQHEAILADLGFGEAPGETPLMEMPASRMEFFASTSVGTVDGAELDLPATSYTSPVVQLASPAAPAIPPLLVWVLGMTGLLMMRWERRDNGPALSPAKTGWARCRKHLAALSALFERAWRPDAVPGYV